MSSRIPHQTGRRRPTLWCAVVWLGFVGGAWASPPEQSLQAALEEVLARDASIPGVIAAVSAPRLGIEWDGAAGRVAHGSVEPLTAHHAIRIASITKVYVAATVLRLVEDRRLGLQDPITGVISEQVGDLLRAGGYDPAAITVAQLLAHTSGLFDYASSECYRAAVLSSPSRRWQRIDQIRFAVTHGSPLGAPGERFGYSDTGYVILGAIVERITGKSLPAVIADQLALGPEGERQTHFERLELAPHGQRRAVQYLGTTNVNEFDPSMDLHGGGGLVSTVGEMVGFIRPLLQGRLFHRRETLAAALISPPIQDVAASGPRALLLPAQSFGGRTCWGHVGFWGTLVLYCPDIDVAVAVAVNQAAPNPPVLKDTAAADGLIGRLAAVIERALADAAVPVPDLKP